jgi:hypothetical protein
MYELGDSIVVKQTNEDGKVVEIINEKMVMIEVRGVRFPAYSDQIEYPYYKMFTQKKEPEKKKIYVDDIKKEKPIAKQKTDNGVHLRFIPIVEKDIFDDDVVDKLKVYLVNENASTYIFEYSLVFGSTTHFDLKSEVRGFSEFYLHDINFEDVSDNPRFQFIFSLVETIKKKAAYFEAGFKVTGKKMFKRIEQLQADNDASFSYNLFTEYPDKIADNKIDVSSLGKSGFRIFELGKTVNMPLAARSVVDLHIEKLVDNYADLTSGEILDIQLKEFEKWYDHALLHKQKTLTIIHGLGKGVLKSEIHSILSNKREVSGYHNLQHPQFGMGSTEIIFK